MATTTSTSTTMKSALASPYAPLVSAAVGLATGLFIANHLRKRADASAAASTLHPATAAAATPAAATTRTPDGPQVAVVTGGSRGIGAAISRKLGLAGYKVAVVFQHSAAKADAIVAEIVAGGGVAASFQCDVGSEREIVAMFAAVKETLGPVTALVNNAGIIGKRAGTLDDQTVEDLLPVFAVNTFGPFVCTREATRQMSTANGGAGGAVVNISSGSALIGTPIVYAMSKGALNSMATGVRDELVGQGVRINSISPGLTATAMVTEEMARKIVPGIPMKRMGSPEEIADVAVWLLSTEASYVCGAHIRVAGGRMMGGLQ